MIPIGIGHHSPHLAMGLALVVFLFAPLRLCVRSSAGDWSHWRGPSQNGVSPEKELPEKFSLTRAGENNLVWKADFGCRSTPLVLGGRVYVNNHTGKGALEQERVMCLDADTGRKLWEHTFNVFHTDIVSARVGWTNLAADPATGNVYCHGTQGLLTAFDKDGKILWQRSLTEEFGRISGYGGRLPSPIVDGDLVIQSMVCSAWGEYARGGTRLVAFDKKTGAVAWWGSTGHRVRDTHGSTPTVAEIAGQRLILAGGGDGGVHAFKARTGEKVWSHLFSGGAVNGAPVVDGTLVYSCHGEVNTDTARQGRVICLDAAEVKDGKPKVAWQVDGLKIKFASPVLHEGRLYLNDEDAVLHCLDAKTGKRLWEFKFGRGSNNRCSPVLADGKLYLGDASGRFHVLAPGDKKCQRLHQQLVRSLTPGVDGEFDGSPAVANGRVFFSTNDRTFCVGRANARAGAEGAAARAAPSPLPLSPSEGERGRGEGGGKPAHLQVFPAEVTLAPGGSASFKARLYDDKGNFLREVKPKWSLGAMQGPEPTVGLPPPPAIKPPPLRGEVSADGKLTVPADAQGQFGAVVAEAEGLTGRARVRQAPRLPYREDFDKRPAGSVPGGWVNTQGKFAIRKVGDSNVLVKLANNASPLVSRANAYAGTPGLADYTIEADVMGGKAGSDLPDMGVVANRYTLQMTGNQQQLRIVSWDALPRVDRTIAFPWKDGTWYRVKLTVSVSGGKAVARGKVWERGQAEPSDWTVEVEDPSPNRAGAPALYANATGIPEGGVGAEVYFDNVVITPNKK